MAHAEIMRSNGRGGARAGWRRGHGSGRRNRPAAVIRAGEATSNNLPIYMAGLPKPYSA